MPPVRGGRRLWSDDLKAWNHAPPAVLSTARKSRPRSPEGVESSLGLMTQELPSTWGNFGSPVRASGQSGTTGPVWEWSTTIEKEDDMTGEPVHSGNELCENLDVLGMSAADLCRRIEVPVSRITERLNVRRAVTGNTALRPSRVFKT